MLTNFFAPLAVKIGAGVIVALLAVIGIMAWQADNIARERDIARERATVAELSHRITAASLNALQAELEAMVTDGEIRAERRDEALREVRESTDLLREQAEAFDIETAEGL